VKTEPADVDPRDLAQVLQEQWALVPERLQYAPVGFGDYHWDITDTAGDRWFVTVADLRGGWRAAGPAAGYADLRAALETVTAVRQAGLDFAVAPVATTAGQVLAALGREHAVTVFPHLDGAAGDFGAELAPADRLVLIGMLAKLHDATPLVARTAPARSPALATRPGLDAALGELDRPWNAGPYGEPARRLLAARAPQLGRALARFDELAQQAASAGPAVLTHGEPHPGNLLRCGGRLLLIDWDTAGLARPERDLWSVVGDDRELAGRYTALTGRAVSAAGLRLYRLRWSLDDIAQFIRDFRGAHEQTADTQESWLNLTELLELILSEQDPL
jgi:spectinomycin phosphotransferase